MPIPDYESIMLPLLKFASDGIEHSSKDAIENLSKVFNLTQEEKTRLYQTKNVAIFYDRVHWALSYLKHANILEGTKRGFFKITERGQNLLKQPLHEIDDKFLRQFPEFVEFQHGGKKNEKQELVEKQSIHSNRTPIELLEESYKIVTDELANELLI